VNKCPAPPCLIRAAAFAALQLAGAVAQAQGEPVPDTRALGELMARSAQAISGAGARVEVEVGTADPRLRLAPCQRTQAYLPQGYKPLGRTRVGLRCLEGAARWNITLAATVRVWANAQVVSTALPAGTIVGAEHLRSAEVDWAEASSAPFESAAAVLGRKLARPLAAGAAVRGDDLERRQFFASGDIVQVVARGPGYSVSGEGQALQTGFEGQPVRVRTASGRLLSGRPVGERVVEVSL
jgi:flagella basal body P-ring formation protein FlgA